MQARSSFCKQLFNGNCRWNGAYDYLPCTAKNNAAAAGDAQWSAPFSFWKLIATLEDILIRSHDVLIFVPFSAFEWAN